LDIASGDGIASSSFYVHSEGAFFVSFQRTGDLLTAWLITGSCVDSSFLVQKKARCGFHGRIMSIADKVVGANRFIQTLMSTLIALLIYVKRK
jgi:hypothetical protein